MQASGSGLVAEERAAVPTLVAPKATSQVSEIIKNYVKKVPPEVRAATQERKRLAQQETYTRKEVRLQKSVAKEHAKQMAKLDRMMRRS